MNILKRFTSKPEEKPVFIADLEPFEEQVKHSEHEVTEK